jgi:two-component system sensor histidine kinase/response regulator
MATREHFDAILMDMQMPEMDGIDATRTLQSLPDWAGTPIIAMTANAMESDRKRCLSAGMVDFVAKPIEPVQLFKTLLRWCRKDGGTGVRTVSAVVWPPASSPIPLSTAPLPSLRQLPAQINGLDIQAGLRRVMGREDRYLELLQNFVREQRDACERITQALSKGKVPEAERLTHTLKGLAGTIGAGALHDAAQRLENEIAGPDASTRIPEVTHCLQSLVAALQPVTGTDPSIHAAAPVADTTAQREAMETLVKLLRDDDANAQRHFAKHQELLRSPLGAHFKTIQNAVNSFALDQALEIVETITP